MGAGIALAFRTKFGHQKELRAKGVGIGGVAYIKVGARPLFYLVTKEHYYDKPTYQALKDALIVLRNSCVEQKIEHLAIPRLGCGLDKLDWKVVLGLVMEAFAGQTVTQIHVCLQ